MGPFEEEEEGTGVVSDVVKVKGEDPATPGLLPQGIDPGTVTIPQYRFNKNNTHNALDLIFQSALPEELDWKKREEDVVLSLDAIKRCLTNILVSPGVPP